MSYLVLLLLSRFEASIFSVVQASDNDLVQPCFTNLMLVFIYNSLILNVSYLYKINLIGNNIFTATYSPRAPGTYLLNVLWSGRQVRGCPLKVIAEPGGTNNKVSL